MVTIAGKKKIDRKKIKFLEWAKKKLGEDFDKTDIEARYDSQLTLAENKTQFAKFLKERLDIRNDEYEAYIDDWFAKAKKELKKRPVITEIKGFYKPVYDTIGRLKLKSNNINLIFCKGRGGIGKSFNIRQALLENKVDYEEYQTVTEATLPEILYRNEDKTLWFKDVVKIFNNPNAIDIIKAATETDTVDGGRLICVNKYSHELKKAGVPRKFIFKGNIIFDYNYLEHTNYQEDFEALKSRGYCVDLVFDYEKMCQIMRLITNSEQESKVTEFLIDNYRFVGHNAFNLRTQAKAINTYNCAIEQGINWEEALLEELKNVRSRTQEWLYQFVGEGIVKRKDLVKLIMRTGIVTTERTAYQRIKNWEYGDEIFEVAHGVYSLTPDMPKAVKEIDKKLRNEVAISTKA